MMLTSALGMAWWAASFGSPSNATPVSTQILNNVPSQLLPGMTYVHGAELWVCLLIPAHGAPLAEITVCVGSPSPPIFLQLLLVSLYALDRGARIPILELTYLH